MQLNIEDMIKVIDETYRRAGGRMPVRLICGQKLFQDLCDEAKIEYDVGNVMVARFYGIPIISTNDTNLVDDDKIIVLPGNWNETGFTQDYYYDWWNRPTYNGFNPYNTQQYSPIFQTQYLETPMRDVNDDIDISEEEFLKVLNGGG